MKWKRLRKIVGSLPKKEEYQSKKKILPALSKLAAQGSIDLRYLDETGFCLTPYVPYGWQEKNETRGINSKQSKRLNVIGLLNTKLEALTVTNVS